MFFVHYVHNFIPSVEYIDYRFSFYTDISSNPHDSGFHIPSCNSHYSYIHRSYALPLPHIPDHILHMSSLFSEIAPYYSSFISHLRNVYFLQIIYHNILIFSISLMYFVISHSDPIKKLLSN